MNRRRLLFIQAIKDSWIDKHLIAYFPYNNNSDDVVQGITPISLAVDYDAGYNGQSAKFDGTNNKYINYPSAPFTFTDGVSDKPFTIFGWFYFDGDGNYFFVNKRELYKEEYQINTYGGKLAFAIASEGRYNKFIRIKCYSYPVDVYFHLIATYDGGEDANGMTLYINGIRSVDEISPVGEYNGMSDTGTELTVGNPKWSSKFNLNGNIDGLGFLDIFVDDAMAMELYQKHLVDEIRN